MKTVSELFPFTPAACLVFTEMQKQFPEQFYSLAELV